MTTGLNIPPADKKNKKYEVKLTASHSQYAYRCFLPDLAGFGNLPLHRT